MVAARHITTWALSIGLLAAFGCDGGRIADLNDRIAKLGAEKAQLSADLTTAKNATSQARADLKVAKDETEKAVAGIADLNGQLEVLKTAEADAKKLAEQAQTELANAKSAAEQARTDLASAKSAAEQTSTAMQAERDRTAVQMKAAAVSKTIVDIARAAAKDLSQQVAELTGKLTDAQAALYAAHKEIEALKKKPEGGQP